MANGDAKWQVSGGADVCAYFSFHMKMFPSSSGVFSFSIPLCFPFYTKGFYGDKQLQVPWFWFSEVKQPGFSGSPFKIKLFICAKEGQNIRDCSYNFPLQVSCVGCHCMLGSCFYELQPSEIG